MITAAQSIDLLTYALADEYYALPMPVVREVLRWRAPTVIPGTPAAILGVIHHRGAVLPVLDIRALLGLPAPPSTRATRLLLVDHDGIHAAIVCDAVADIIAIDAGTVEPSPASLPAAQTQFVAGLVVWNDQPVALLNVAAIFAAVQATRHAA